MRCTKCQTLLGEGSLFCPECGKKVSGFEAADESEESTEEIFITTEETVRSEDTEKIIEAVQPARQLPNADSNAKTDEEAKIQEKTPKNPKERMKPFGKAMLKKSAPFYSTSRFYGVLSFLFCGLALAAMVFPMTDEASGFPLLISKLDVSLKAKSYAFATGMAVTVATVFCAAAIDFLFSVKSVFSRKRCISPFGLLFIAPSWGYCLYCSLNAVSQNTENSFFGGVYRGAGLLFAHNFMGAALVFSFLGLICRIIRAVKLKRSASATI